MQTDMKLIKLHPGEIKSLVWKDRQRLWVDQRFLYEKFVDLQRHFLKKGFPTDESRSLSMLFLTFPLARTLKLYPNEIAYLVQQILTIVISYEATFN